MRVERAYFSTLNRGSGRERGCCQESPHGCRRWYPHPAENPFARNWGWLGAVVTLSSTGDAACGLHKQRLHHTGGRDEVGVMFRPLVVYVSHPATLATIGEHLVVSRHLSRCQLVPWQNTRGFKDAPSAKQQTSLFDACCVNRWIVSLPLCHTVLSLSLSLSFSLERHPWSQREENPSKYYWVKSGRSLRRLSRLAVLWLRLGLGFPSSRRLSLPPCFPVRFDEARKKKVVRGAV